MCNNNKLEQEMDLKKGVYIPTVDAKWLYKYNSEINDYVVKDKYLKKLLNGKLDFSHELLFNKELIDNIKIHSIKGKLYTLDVVNVTYNGTFKNADGKLNINQLRDWSYSNGFTFNNNKFSNWKRSSGKARIGENLFILDSIRDKCLDWARMGLEFEGKVDIASIRAYESLPLSSVIGSIKIEHESILVIDDFESVFNWEMSKTYINSNKDVKTELGTVQECNKIWDGQALLDSSVFADVENELLNGKSMALLRNRLFKSCAFNTNISLFFQDYCTENGYDYDTYTIEDIRGKNIAVKDIKMITTPSSIKIKKLYGMASNVNRKIDWLTYFLANCGNDFSVCKTDHASYLSKVLDNGQVEHFNRLSYQMFNTIPFQKEEINVLLKDEIEYIEKLKNDNDFFIQEIGATKNIDEIDEIDDEIDLEGVLNTNLDTTNAFTQMYFKNKDFGQTSVFKNYKKTYVDSYLNTLKKGKVKVEGDYCTVLSNPIEMLDATVNKFNGQAITLTNNQIYCKMFANDEEIVGFRNPFVCVGNLFNCINTNNKLISKYVNAGNNIVVINSINYPVLTINQSMDMDSDTMLLTNNKLINKCSRRINYTNTPIPVNLVENSGDNNKELTQENMSNTDVTISQNFIGEVINVSQTLNSILASKIYNGTITNKEYEDIYSSISRCSSFSCVEIDKAKKQFKDLNVSKELLAIKNNFVPKVDEDKIIDITCTINTLKEDLKYAKENKNKDEIEIIEKEIKIAKVKLSKLDSRAIKPYFFKFVGDSKTIKQRKTSKNNYFKKLLSELYFTKNDKTNDNIELFKTKTSNKKIKEFIKTFDKEDIKHIKKEVEIWENRQFVKMECNMNFLQDVLGTIKNAKSKTTLEVIQLIKENKHKTDEDSVASVKEIIKNTDNSITLVKGNAEMDYKQKYNVINTLKNECYIKLQEIKITKAILYRVLILCLNKVTNTKNPKTNRYNKNVEKSGIESLALEILFKHYPQMLTMFK